MTADDARRVETRAALVGLPLAPEQQALVAEHLATVLRAAALVMEFPPPEEVEPAPVFRP